MKNLIILAFAALLIVSNSFAAETSERRVTQANSVQHNRTNNIMKIDYSTGGCRQSDNQPRMVLEHVSTKDITPAWALEQDPDTIREFQVIVNVVVKEKMGRCMMAYDLSVSGDLGKLFREMAPSLGIDLPAKKAHYSVEFVAPQVKSYETFSAFDEE